MMLEQLGSLQRVEGVPIMVDTGIVFVIRNLPVTFQTALDKDRKQGARL